MLIPHFPQPSQGHSLLTVWQLGLSLPSGLKVSCAFWERLAKSRGVGLISSQDMVLGVSPGFVLAFPWTINEIDKEVGSQHVILFSNEKKKKQKIPTLR